MSGQPCIQGMANSIKKNGPDLAKRVANSRAVQRLQGVKATVGEEMNKSLAKRTTPARADGVVAGYHPPPPVWCDDTQDSYLVEGAPRCVLLAIFLE